MSRFHRLTPLFQAVRELTAALLLAFSACAISSELPLKTFTRYNATKEKVVIESLSGIYTFGKNDVRSSIKGMPVWADQRQQEATLGAYIEVEYPITLKWHYASSPSKSFTTTFNEINGIEGTKLRKEGSLVLFFGKDRTWHLKWVPDKSHLTVIELRKMAGVSE